jgi:hypothetical protein
LFLPLLVFAKTITVTKKTIFFPCPWEPGQREDDDRWDKKKCQYCRKDAIGYQEFGCCPAYGCAGYARTNLLALKPGEKLSGDECYPERFD